MKFLQKEHSLEAFNTEVMKTLNWNMIQLMFLLTPGPVLGQDIIKKQQKGLNYLWKNYVETSMISQFNYGHELDDNTGQLLKLSLKPELKVKIHKKWRLTSILRLYGDVLDNLEKGRPPQTGFSKISKPWLIGDRIELELRELYLDWFVGEKSTVRLGKQQIVWGETDGLKLLDVINPQNFREFMLEDFQDSRIPLWSIKGEFPIRDVDVEIVWIPDLTYHEIPSFGSPYFPTAMMPAANPTQPVEFLDGGKPDRIIKDSDIGLKVSTFLKGWDISLNYLYHYDDLPVPDFHLNQDSDDEHQLQVQMKYHRMHTLGGSFNNAIGPISIRGEIAYNFRRYFISSSINTSDNKVVSDQFMLAIGADWLFKETMLSVQFFNDFLLHNMSANNREQYERYYSLLGSQELLNDNLKIELQMVQNLNRGDGMIRPKVSYYLRSNLQVNLGSTIFHGNQNGFFGQYKKRSRLLVGLEWGL